MEEQSHTLIRLYFETRDNAEATAESLRSEGLGATVGNDLTGNAWSVSVSGDEEQLQALAHRLHSERAESD